MLNSLVVVKKTLGAVFVVTAIFAVSTTAGFVSDAHALVLTLSDGT